LVFRWGLSWVGAACDDDGCPEECRAGRNSAQCMDMGMGLNVHNYSQVFTQSVSVYG
jgi:hypothetical protein